MQWCCQLLQSIAKSRAEFYFVQCLAQQKNCETTHVTLQFSSNLSRNSIARQVAEKIAQCNRALRQKTKWYFGNKSLGMNLTSIVNMLYICICMRHWRPYINEKKGFKLVI